MEISKPNTNNVCDGFRCFKEAKYTITEKVNNNCITFQLCGSCVSNYWINSISGSTKTKKKELEQQVVEPECSNTNSVSEFQQPEVLLND